MRFTHERGDNEAENIGGKQLVLTPVRIIFLCVLGTPGCEK